jgi:putative Mg2+ transporter-C (MgtC) family protein
MDGFPSTLETVVRMGLAVLAGGILGLERQWHRKPAGLRTHMMVSLGAAAFTLIALQVQIDAATAGVDAIRLDPLRYIAGLVGGIGFLGAGTIIQSRHAVHGLTTAASIWTAGALGAACGAGYYLIAGITAASAIVVLLIFGFLEFRLGLDEEHEKHHHR